MGGGERGRRFVVCGFCLLVLAATMAAAAPAAVRLQGRLDRSFGSGGHAILGLGSTLAPSSFSEMLLEPGGGVVLAGRTEAAKGIYNESTAYLQRRGPNGELDSGFGGGMIEAPAIAGLVRQGDGRILFGVPRSDPCASTTLVHRIDPSGSPDPSYGKDGVSVTVPLAVSDLAVDAAGRTVLAGATNTNPCGHDPVPILRIAVARLLPDGSLDPAFGKDGVVRAGEEDAFSGGAVNGLAVREDGSVVVAGAEALFGFTPSGAPDPAFGKDGVVAIEGTTGALLGLPGGKTVLASTSATGYGNAKPGHFILSRYQADGNLDPSFGGGSVSLGVGAVDQPTALAAGPEGSVLLGGETAASDDCSDGECDFAPFLARFDSAGALDPGWGQGGQASLGLPPRTFTDYARYVAALAVAPSGRVLVAGGSGGAGDASLSALQANGAPDLSFGSGGSIADSHPLQSVTDAFRVATGPGGEIVTSAWSNAGAHRSRAILLGSGPNGLADPAFGAGAEYVVPETGGELQADGHGHFYTLTTAYRGRGQGYVARFGADGGRDLGYGSQGKAYVPGRFDVESMLVRPGGGVLLTGRVARRLGMAAFKLTPQGRPDRRFGRNGLAVVGWGKGVKADALAAAVDRRGRVVLFGNEGPYAGMVRLRSNGRLDRSFAYRGRQPYMPGLANEESAVEIAPDGGILIAAAPEASLGPLPTTLIRFRPDGIRDRGFGHNGVVRVGVGAPMVGFFAGRRLLLVSAVGGFGEHGVEVRAFRPDGSPDRSFGRRGVVRAATAKRQTFRPVDAARQPDGRIVVAGTRGKIEEAGSSVELLRFR